MGNLLYIVAVILIIGWLIGFIGYGAGGIIHILLVIAIIAVLIQVIQGRRSISRFSIQDIYNQLDSLGEPFDVFAIRDKFLGVSNGRDSWRFLIIKEPIKFVKSVMSPSTLAFSRAFIYSGLLSIGIRRTKESNRNSLIPDLIHC